MNTPFEHVLLTRDCAGTDEARNNPKLFYCSQDLD